MITHRATAIAVLSFLSNSIFPFALNSTLYNSDLHLVCKRISLIHDNTYKLIVDLVLGRQLALFLNVKWKDSWFIFSVHLHMIIEGMLN